MSKLDELIEEWCPDGVRREKLGLLCEIKTGKGLKQKECIEDGKYPVISGGKTPMGYYSEYYREANNVTISRVGANAGFVLFITERFYVNDKCFAVIPYKEDVILTKFLYYCLKNIERDIISLQSQGGVPTINTKKVSNIEIFIPPLEVQEEIVRILDSFTELTARKKQYEYFLNDICDFRNDNSIKYMSVGDLFEIKNGLNKGKEYFGNGIQILNYMDVNKHEINNEHDIKGLVELTDEEIERFSVKPNDLFFTRTSETSNEIGLTSAYVGNAVKCVFSGFLLRARPKIDVNSIFFSYYLRSPKQRAILLNLVL